MLVIMNIKILKYFTDKGIKAIIKKVSFIIIIITLIVVVSSCNLQSTTPNYNTVSKIESTYPTESESIKSDNNEYLNYEKFEFRIDEWQEKTTISDEYNQYNLPIDKVWFLHLEDDKIMIEPTPNYRPLDFRFDVEDGYFLSENNGEFGGKIDFINNDGITYTVLECRPIEMFSINNDIYLLDGISHMGYVVGHLYKLGNTNGKWEVEKELDLGGVPDIYLIDKTDIYIIIYFNYNDDGNRIIGSKIIKISTENNDIKMQEIVETVAFHNLVCSMVKKDNMLYIGLAGSIATVDLNSKEIKFYTKK